MKFKKIKEFKYQRRDDSQLKFLEPKINNQQVQLQLQPTPLQPQTQPQQQNNRIKNENQINRQNEHPPHRPNIPNTFSNQSQNQQSQKVVIQTKLEYYMVENDIPKKVPYLFLVYFISMLVNFSFGIAIFSTQGSETAIVVFQVFIILTNIISGIYYYTKSTLLIFSVQKCFRTLFWIIIVSFILTFIQLIICWSIGAEYAFELINLFILISLQLYLWYKRREYQKQ